LFEVFEMAVCVPRLAFSSRPEYRCDVVLPLDVGFRGEVQIAAIRLGFTCERGFEIVVGLRAFELHDASV
jgi:hypothetical protein